MKSNELRYHTTHFSGISLVRYVRQHQIHYSSHVIGLLLAGAITECLEAVNRRLDLSPLGYVIMNEIQPLA